MNSASLCSLAGRYENPIPPRCLAPIDFLKIPAQGSGNWEGTASVLYSSTVLYICTGCNDFNNLNDPNPETKNMVIAELSLEKFSKNCTLTFTGKIIRIVYGIYVFYVFFTAF
jgi:hypothetical protein